jgi:hypothetical protein
MANYTFDGTNLKEGSTTIANVKGNEIRKGLSSSVIGNIKGDEIRQGSGSAVLFNVKNDEIRQGPVLVKLQL